MFAFFVFLYYIYFNNSKDLQKGVVTMKVADAIVKLLIANGVEVIFGVPGDTSMTFHHAIEAHHDQIKYIGCRDERHAGYMADTYARVSGKPGIVDVPSGGGVLYVAAALSEATASSIPLICFSSDIARSSQGTGALTELRQEEFLKSVTKWNTTLTLASKLPHTIKKAFRIATSGRPGAVHLSIPEDIHEQDFDFPPQDLIASDQKAFKNAPNDHDVLQAYELLYQASRPVIIAGGGVHLSQAYQELEELAFTYTIPVATSINGKGSVTETSAQSVGVIGVNGGMEPTNKVIQEADVVMVLGSKLNNVTTVAKTLFKQSPKVIQVDVSEEMLDLNIPADVAIMSDIRLFLRKLNQFMAESKRDFVNELKDWNEWVQKQKAEKQKQIEQELKEETQYVNAARIIEALDKQTDDDALFVIDAGTQNPYMAAHFKLKSAGRKTVFDRGHGNLGYALSASIGAQLARPQAKVFSLFGDGSFAMSAGELETASRLHLPIVFIHFQNHSYGWIKKLHQLYYDERYIGVDFKPIDGAKIAEGFGVKSMTVEKNSQIEQALTWALEQDGPVFLDMLIDPITNIVPPVTNWRADSKKDPKDRKALTY